MAGKGTKRTLTDEQFMQRMEVWAGGLEKVSNFFRLYELARDGLKWRQMEHVTSGRKPRAKKVIP
jgi:hypothetical protein